MEHEICHVVKENLKDRPKQLTDLRQWLFVTVNTAKAIIDNTSKQSVEQVFKFTGCRRTSEMQLEFDAIQGKFGREGFSRRHSPSYLYLCALVAAFPDQALSDEDQAFIRECAAAGTYLVYEL